jgi:2-iminobutanoate/2-iminopropanoate deaminase
MMESFSSRMLIVVGALACGLSGAQAADKPTYLNSGKILPTTLPFSEAVKVGNTYYLSGQIGNSPGSLKLAEGGIKGESKQVMDNIKTTLEAHGLSMSDVVKCTVMLADMAEWNDFNEVYKTYFTAGNFPARSAFGSSGLAFKARAEVECIAVSSK